MIKAARGTRDILPPDTALWNFVEATVRDVLRAYNFQEIRTPIFESTELFARGVGEDTDIVSKEMFTWEDGERFNDKSLIEEWLRKNESDDPAHSPPPGRINVYRSGPFLEELRKLKIQLQVSRGLPSQYGTFRDCVEFIAFRQEITRNVIDALRKARETALSQYTSEFANNVIRLRLVVPAEAAKKSPWIETENIEVEGFPGRFFLSTQLLTLRPENTAGVVRAYIEHRLSAGGLNKLYYIGPQFRRERPQKGRYRQFYQIGAEVIGPPHSGSARPLRDAEVLEMLDTLLRRLGIRDFNLDINSVGDPVDRRLYNAALRAALAPIAPSMCSDCQRRAVENPLRVFDCKVPSDQPIIESLPVIAEYLGTESKQHFEDVKALLAKANVPFRENPRLVRGLDYYTRTAFEFTHGALGAQNAILGGGRYDGLAELLGSPEPAPGIGFAIGEDRLIMALQEQGKKIPQGFDVYIAPVGEGMNRIALSLAKELRSQGITVELGDRSFRLRKMFELATKAGAVYALVVGENEANTDAFGLKDLTSGRQVSVARAKLAARIRRGVSRRRRQTAGSSSLRSSE